MNNEINVRTLCSGVDDERANDKEAISQFLSDTSANASGSILYFVPAHELPKMQN